MVDKNFDILNNVPVKSSTNKSIIKIDKKLENDRTQRKWGTSVNSEMNTDILRNMKRNNTFSKSISELQILKLMSENANEIVKNKDYDSDDYSDDGNTEEIKVSNRKINIKTKTLKLLTGAFKKRSSSIKLNKKEKEDVVSQQNKEGKTDNQDNIFSFDNKEKKDSNKNIIDVKDKIPEENGEKEDEEGSNVKFNYTTNEDEILSSLINRHYLDIVENFPGNFEEYVVNNLTIISYLDLLYSNNAIIPSLTDESYTIVKSFDPKKKILFLDLDETLIHSDLNNAYEYWDDQIFIPYDDNITAKFNILYRPYLNQFLEFASKNFNVVLFTAGVKSYADAILFKIDPRNEYFHLKLYRESCFQYKNFFIKDLSILEKFELKDMILVDNCLFSFARNLKNGVLVTSFYNDSNDEELLNLLTYLENHLLEVSDIREVNEGFYGFDAIKIFLLDKLRNEGYLK